MKWTTKFFPRKIQELIAKLGDYFWVPCDICGEYFGGHEVDEDYVTVRSPYSDSIACPWCSRIVLSELGPMMFCMVSKELGVDIVLKHKKRASGEEYTPKRYPK